MSTLVNHRKFNYFSTKADDLIFNDNDNDDDDFNFKYVPSTQFNNIVKDVQRQRSKKDEERLWMSFLQQQDQKVNENIPDTKRIAKLNYELMDLELKDLKEDTHLEDSSRFRTVRIKKKWEQELENSGELSAVRPVDSSRFKTSRIAKNRELESTKAILSPKKNQLSPSASTVTLFANEIDDCDDNDAPTTLDRFPVTKLNLESSKYPSRNCNNHVNRHKNMINHCNSSPELSSQYESDQESEIYEIRSHPNVAQKILGIQTKISELLDEILYRLGRIPRPDDENDMKRRQQRVIEFGIRFSRNYLYDLGRQMMDIQRHMKAIEMSLKEKAKRRGVILHMQAIEQKLISAHQLLANALDAYAKHIPSSAVHGSSGKLKDILQVVIELKEICNKINLSIEFFGSGDSETYPLGNDVQARCYEILAKLHSPSTINSPSAFSHGTQSTHGFPSPTDKRRKNQLESRKALSNRLSMYNVGVEKKPQRYPRNRRPVTVGMYPKELKQSFARMPFKNPPPTPEQSHSNSIIHKSSKSRRKTKINGLLHEDKISTMMDLIPAESETRMSTTRLSRKIPSTIASENKIARRVKSATKQSRPSTKLSSRHLEKENDTEKIKISEEHLSNLVPVIADLMALVSKNKNESVQSDSDSLASLQQLIDRYGKSKISKGNRQDNTKLICLNKEKRESKFVDASCQASQNNLSSTENKKYLEVELIVNEEATQRLLNYQGKFHEVCLSNPIYKSKNSNKPWELVAWIADKLVEDLLADITRELQMNEVIRRLFELEFEEF